MTLLFRTMNLGKDRQTIVNFRKDLLQNTFGSDEGFDEEKYVNFIETGIRDFSDGFVLVEENGDIIGQLEVRILSDCTVPYGYVHMFYLTPDYRGKGYGLHLLAYVNQYLTNSSVQVCQLRVVATNKQAFRFYEKNEFTKICTEQIRGLNFFRMSKELHSHRTDF